MDALREWLAENFVGSTAPLFEAAGLLVTTFNYGRRKTLKRHPDFDHLMIERVEPAAAALLAGLRICNAQELWRCFPALCRQDRALRTKASSQ